MTRYLKCLSGFIFIGMILTIPARGQQRLKIQDPYLKIRAGRHDPLYTTYTAAMQRSRLYGDKGYKMVYYEPDQPVCYRGDQAGRFMTVWMVNRVVLDKTEKFSTPPVVTASFPDMAVTEYELLPGLQVQETFLVYSSSLAVVQLFIENNSDLPHDLSVYPVLELPHDSLRLTGYDKNHHALLAQHYETKKRLISNLYANAPYPQYVRDVFAVSNPPFSFGGYQGDMSSFYRVIKTDWYAVHRTDSLNMAKEGKVDYISLHVRFHLEPGEKKQIRYYRGWQDRKEPAGEIFRQIDSLHTVSLQTFTDQDIRLFRHIPRIDFSSPDEKLVYLGAYNLARGCMLPPSGKTQHNFYVFSRNPLWGWGHGHQVMHESLSMLAYVYLDPASAEESQRVFIEQQGEDGLIPYRAGPRGPQTYPHKGEPTTSSPFFSWTNLEIFRVSRDTAFLTEAYASGAKYVNWLIKHRDKDHDGLFEWGPYGLIENVRDWYNVVFQVSGERHLDIDKEDISDELECLDLSLMVVKEEKSLAEMAHILGREKDARQWMKKADKTSSLINKTMWDPETGFYYHVDMKNHSFRFMTRSLKREEIIGFLALWAGVADTAQARILVNKLTDPEKFWRRFGVPTLSADDPFYSPYVDYCCKWNGPVWLLWDYLVYDGLKKYGYDNIASDLARKMLKAVTTQLAVNHNYWESYSPDFKPLDCPSNYIWDAIMAKLLIREYEQ